jgi:TonB-dependent starch-binding outer membrane protein SusC
MNRCHWLVAMVIAVAALPALAVAQDTGTVAGTVVEAATQRPLAGVHVTIVGTRLGSLTNQEGRFLITNVPAGTQEVRATMFGYARSSETVTVAAGATVTTSLSIRETAIELEGITVNPITGREERRRELGTNTASIQTADVNPATVNSLSDLLAARAPGVTIQQSSGTLGTSERIRIRSTNSVSLSNEPLVYIDGVRASRSMAGWNVGGASPSRLNDLNTNDIESIEILKGPAATAMYGTAAAAGVLLITTKRGQTGPARWNAYVEMDQLQDITQYPDNYVAVGILDPNQPIYNTRGFLNDGRNVIRDDGTIGPSPQAVQPCLNVAAAAGLCRQDQILTHNTLLDARTRPFQTGHRQVVGLNASGGVQGVNYYLSGEFEEGQGIVRHNQQDKASFRANLRADLREDVTVNVMSGFVRHRLAMNGNDNSVFSPLINGLLGRPWFVDYDADAMPNPGSNRNYGWGYSIDHLAEYPVNQDVQRLTIGITTDYRPLSWLSANANFGIDFIERHDHSDIGAAIFPLGGSWDLGFRGSERSSANLLTGGLSSTASFNLTDAIASTTTAGVNLENTSFESTYCFGAALIPGTRSCGAASTSFTVDEDFQKIVTFGTYLQQAFAFGDRLFLTASIRGDDDSNFGEDFSIAWFPGANASWVLSEEAWFPQTTFVPEFRVRAAAGQAGLRPGFRQARQLFAPVPTLVGGVAQPGVILDTSGNPDLRPERSTEWELGFDAGLLNDRVGLEFTYYTRTSRDAIVARNVAPSLGLTATVLENLGSMQNSGTELAANIRVLQTQSARGNLRLAHTTLRNRIADLGEGVELGTFNRGTQRHVEGYPMGGFWQVPVEWDTPEAGQTLGLNQVRVVLDADGLPLPAQYIGPSLPTWGVTVGGDLSFFQNLVTVSTLFESRGGNYQYNHTEFFRCNTGAQRADSGCRAAWDPAAPVDEQARLIAGRFGALAPDPQNPEEMIRMGTVHGYVEPADFIKWRELAVSLGVPPALTQRFAMLNGVTVTLAGRNLATWTEYGGLDPEINETGGGTNFTQGEFNTQPPLRQLTARVNVAF